MILLTTGMFAVGKPLTTYLGLAVIGAGLSVGVGGLTSYGQGLTAAAGIGAVAKRPEDFGRCVVMAVMSETFALFGLLGNVLILYVLGLFG